MIRKTILNTIYQISPKMGYLNINLTSMYRMLALNYKTMMREIKEDLINGKTYHIQRLKNST